MHSNSIDYIRGLRAAKKVNETVQKGSGEFACYKFQLRQAFFISTELKKIGTPRCILSSAVSREKKELLRSAFPTKTKETNS